MKNKIKINKKYLDSLGLSINTDELPENAIIKRINFNEDVDNKELFGSSGIDQVKPHNLVQQEEGKVDDIDEQYSIGTITTIDVDSDGDVILPQGIDISRYQKNPVVLFQHNLDMPIGYAEEITVSDEKITAKTRFGSTDEAQKVHQLLKDKVLRTHSIGFVTLEFESRGTKTFESLMVDLKSKFPNKFTDEVSKRVDRVVTKALLLEYSVVTIPANEEAVINEIKSCKKEEVIESIENSQENIEENIEDSIDLVEKEETNKISIKVVKKGNSVKRISTLAEREQEKLRNAYIKLWGV
jgi:phage head maturation protease